MADPLVSVLIPTYRRPHYLRQALDSAVRQTYKSLQIIVRDNASADQTPEVVKSFDDPRIEFLLAPKTGSAWENGIEIIKRIRGKYRVTLCDDDVLGDTYVETLVTLLERDPSILAAYGATHVIDADGTVIRKHVPLQTYTVDASKIIQAWCGGSLPLATGINCVCPTSFMRDLGETYKFPDGHNSDNAVFMAASIRGKVLFTDQCVFYYRIHGQNAETSHKSELRAKGDQAFLEFLDREVHAPGNVGLAKDEWPRARARLRTMLAGAYFHHLLRYRLEKDNLVQLIWDMTVRPTQTYGIGRARTLLSRNRYALRGEMKRRIMSRFRKVSRTVS